MNAVLRPISVVLKEARKNKNVTIEDVYKATKIHPKILRALEEGASLDLGYIYVKSYIKTYAKYLGINQQELEKYFHPVEPKEKKANFTIPYGVEGDKFPSLPARGILAKLRLKFNSYKKIIIISVILFVVLGVLIYAVIKNARLSTKTVKSKPVIGLSAMPKARYIESAKAAPAAKAPAKEKEIKIEEKSFPKIEDYLRLAILAEEDTWMQIKADGNVIFKRVLKKGASETWQAKDSFELWLANAGTIKLELNGKVLSPIGRRGQLLKSVLITKDGLTIKK